MSEELGKITEKLPDVYFDWYARLIPGCFGLAVFLVCFYDSARLPIKDLNLSIVFLLLFVSYLIGHILQPYPGFVVKCIEKQIGNEKAYSEAKRKSEKNESGLGKISKAHAEANSMFACGMTLLLNLGIFCYTGKLSRDGFVWSGGKPGVGVLIASVICLFFIAGIGRILARNRKINDLVPENDKKQASGKVVWCAGVTSVLVVVVSSFLCYFLIPCRLQT